MSKVLFILPILAYSFILSGCATSNKTKHTLQVKNFDDLNLAVYIDSQYIGTTPVTYDVQADTLEGKKLKIVYKGTELKSYPLHKDYIIEEIQDKQNTALAIGAVATGAGFIFIPYPFALLTPLFTFIPSLLIGSPTITGPWIYMFLKNSFPELTQDSAYFKAPLHKIARRWFNINRNYKIPSSTHWKGDRNIFYASGICYDESHKTVWFEKDDDAEVFFPIPIQRVNRCLDTVLTKPRFLGLGQSIVKNSKTCAFFSSSEKNEEWFRQYPCEKISRRKESKTDTQ